jgi:acetate kinase
MPQEAYLYGLPYSYYEKYGIRRYGFHGTSHSYVSKRAAEILGKDIKDLKIIVCHLGNGASISAVKDGKCIDTSMGLTPLEGLIMGTRTGDIDPSVVEFIMKKENSTVADVTNLLNKKSGVYGLSNNLSSDFRDLEDAYLKGDEGAKRAVDAFTYRVAKYIGSYTAAMGGVDVICFTAGVGENSGFTRGLICERLSFLGATVDAEANKVRGEEKTISAADSKVLLMVVPTNEELAIARDTYELCK